MANTININWKVSHPYVWVEKRSRIYLLIGLQTNPFAEEAANLPLNLGLVIDHSGSMAGEKLKQAKSSSCQIIERMTESDIVSVVQFDNNAEVIIKTQTVKKIGHIEKKIKAITAGSSTDIYKALSRGGKEIEAGISKTQVKRCILLTDGFHNGPEPLDKIVRLTEDFREKENISISCLGIGTEYDQNFLNRLSVAGGGNLYHITGALDMNQVFREEFTRVQSIVAQNVNAAVTFPLNVEVNVVNPAYKITKRDNTFHIGMSDMERGKTQNLAIEAKVQSNQQGRARLAQIDITYEDLTNKGSTEKIHMDVWIEYVTANELVSNSINREVLKIVEMIQANANALQIMKNVESGTISRNGALKTIEGLAKEALRLPWGGETVSFFADVQQILQGDDRNKIRKKIADTIGKTR